MIKEHIILPQITNLDFPCLKYIYPSLYLSIILQHSCRNYIYLFVFEVFYIFITTEF